MKIGVGTFASLGGKPVTVIAQAGKYTYYIPGYHFWTATHTDRLVPVDRSDI